MKRRTIPLHQKLGQVKQVAMDISDVRCGRPKVEEAQKFKKRKSWRTYLLNAPGFILHCHVVGVEGGADP